MHIQFKSNSRFDAAWERLWQVELFQRPFYQPASIAFVREYYGHCHFEDCSFIVMDENVPILGIMACLKICDNQMELSAYGRPLLYLENRQASHSQCQRAIKQMKNELDKVLQNGSATSLYYLDCLYSGNLSPLGKYLLNRGAVAYPNFTQLITLEVPEDQLRSQVRKSYKSLINWGLKNLGIKILDSNNIEMKDIMAFRDLHIQESGREVRSKRSWELQYEMVRQREAFVIQGCLKGELVASGLFLHSTRLCYYGVSAANRGKFDKPISHGIIMKAILHAKEIGCEFFEIGEQQYPRQGPTIPSNKELGISTFKGGFGGSVVVRMEIRQSGEA